MKKSLSVFLLFFTCVINAQLDQKLKPLISQYPSNAEIGISIMDEDGKSLFDHNASQNFIPASLQKIITNFAAYELLGPDYKFTTSVGYTGNILPDGNLTGDIIIYGNGDPSLASERFQKRPQLQDVVRMIASFVKSKGITCIDGQVIADASYYGTDGTVHSWAWNDIGNYYACNTWSINIHENYYKLYLQLQSNQNLQPKILRHEPFIPWLTFKNELTSGPAGSGDKSYIFGAPYTYTRHIRGSLPVGSKTFRIKGAMPNSPQYLAQLVEGQLSQMGISSTGSSVEFDDKIKVEKTIGEIKSPKLSDLIQSANLESINLYCESFLVAIGNGSRSEGIKAEKEFLKSNGIDIDDIYIDDGSGLSVWNNISPEDFTYLLGQLYKKYGSSLKKLFPKAGQSGTLSYLFKGLEANGKLWAKTGSMQQVMNYSGFTETKSGRLVTFSIIANRHQISNRRIRKIHEQIMNTIYTEG
jgi:D-alanyl-D-alanine carboxypeptidase/D-alanyl-D-alanine-endopeptidase (penicillin-binding protein 4)